MLGLAVGAMFRWRHTVPRFAYPLAPLLFAVFWGLLQWWTGRTVSPYETRIAVARWATLLAVFIAGLVVFQDARVHRWFRSAMPCSASWWRRWPRCRPSPLRARSFGSSKPNTPSWRWGRFSSRNHYAAFIEVVLPLAIYGSVVRKRESLLYSVMAAVMYAS
jgi:hypothetical protein